MMGGNSAPPPIHSSLDCITEAETIIVTRQRDMLRRNHDTGHGFGLGQEHACSTSVAPVRCCSESRTNVDQLLRLCARSRC
jgi:hypothetical protein